MNNSRYVYHIAYVFSSDENNQSGWGSITVYRNCPIDTEKEVMDTTEFIKIKNNLSRVAILNFILLNDEGR